MLTWTPPLTATHSQDNTDPISRMLNRRRMEPSREPMEEETFQIAEAVVPTVALPMEEEPMEAEGYEAHYGSSEASSEEVEEHNSQCEPSNEDLISLSSTSSIEVYNVEDDDETMEVQTRENTDKGSH
jgi:hypothetical protein